MTAPLPDHAEPPTRLVTTVHVRRGDNLEPVVDELVHLLAEDASVVDLSHYDRRADTIQIRTVVRPQRAENP